MGEAVDTYLLENATVRHALTVAEDTKVEAPALFEVTLDAAHPNALSVLSVDAKAGSSLTVVQVVRGDAENGAAASLTRIRAGENAHVKLVQVQLLGSHARRWNAVAIEEAKSAKVEQVRIELGGALSHVVPRHSSPLPRASTTLMPSTSAAATPCWITTMSPFTPPRTPCARCTPPVS